MIKLVLGIETTCDETACAVVKEGRCILSNVIASQIDIHSRFGGVVPELACRKHVDIIMPVIHQAINEAKISLEEIDLIAAAYGPGLIGALLIGLNTGKALSLAIKKPFINVNHVEAHLYAAIMSHPYPIPFPCLGVVLSGGHTAIVLIHALGKYQLIGQTVDDAVGEAFDKVAKMLGLPYPGGPQIEQLALQGNPIFFSFKGGQVKGKPFDFSFSGLKTAVLYALQKINSCDLSHSKAHLAASFQRAAVEDIIDKTISAAVLYNTNTIIFGGGVTNNQFLRKKMKEKVLDQFHLIWPSFDLSLDNAAMIAGLGYHRYLLQGHSDSMSSEPSIRIPFTLF